MSKLHLPPTSHPALNLRLAALLVVAAVGIGCTSLSTNETQRGNTLLGYVYKNPGSDFIPVIGTSKDGGKILSAHARVYYNELQVSGLVVGPKSTGSHVDVLFLGKRGQLLASTAAGYRAAEFSSPEDHSSHYLAKLPSLPTGTAKVQVVFHGAQRTACPHNMGI